MDTHSNVYHRYRSSAKRFLLVGVACAFVGILWMQFMAVAGILILFVGVVLLALGGSSLQGHNMVKAFARQCISHPDQEIALGLLQALQAKRRLYLVDASIRLVHRAILCYAQTPEADQVLVEQLTQQANETLIQKRF